MYVNRSKMSEKRIICTDFGISFPISFKFRRHSLLFHAALIAHSGFFAGALIGGGYSIFAHGETCNFSEISGKGSSRAISHTLPYSLSRIIGIFRRVKASASLSDAAAVNERGEGAAAMTANDLRRVLGCRPIILAKVVRVKWGGTQRPKPLPCRCQRQWQLTSLPTWPRPHSPPLPARRQLRQCRFPR